MELWTWIVLAGLLFTFAVRRLIDLLEIRRLRRPPDEGGWSLYSEETGSKARSYILARLRLAQAATTVRLTALLAFWALGGFAFLDSVVRSLPEGYDGVIPRGLLFLGILAILGSSVSLPFSIYATFVIEERFGFNRTTPRLFAADLVRGLVLAAIIGGAVGAAALYLLGLGTAGWVALWLLLGVFVVLMQVVMPRIVMPMFNRFDPLPEGKLRDEILSYADDVGFPVDDVQVMDASRRSSKGNAFFTGTGRSRRVVLFDTLVEQHPVREVVAVFAHEVGHYKLGHIVRGLAALVVYSGLILLLFAEVADWGVLSRAIGVGEPSVYAALVAFSLLVTPIGLATDLVGSALSRRRERRADDFAAETTGDPGALAEALVRLGRDNFSDPCPHPAYVYLNYSHPPLDRRVDRLNGSRAVGAPAQSESAP